jgi:hypothetical protein
MVRGGVPQLVVHRLLRQEVGFVRQGGTGEGHSQFGIAVANA